MANNLRNTGIIIYVTVHIVQLGMLHVSSIAIAMTSNSLVPRPLPRFSMFMQSQCAALLKSWETSLITRDCGKARLKLTMPWPYLEVSESTKYG